MGTDRVDRKLIGRDRAGTATGATACQVLHRSTSASFTARARRQRPLGGGYGERPVGGDQPDAGTAVEEVVDVGGALVGDAEDQLGERDRDGVGDRREQLVVGEPGDRAGGVEDERGVGAEASYQPRAGLARRLGELGRAGRRRVSGSVAVTHGPALRPAWATAASTASSAIRRYVVSLPPTIVTTPVGLVSTACLRERSAVDAVAGVEQRPQAGVRADDVAAAQRRGRTTAATTSSRKPISTSVGSGTSGTGPSAGSSVRPT